MTTPDAGQRLIEDLRRLGPADSGIRETAMRALREIERLRGVEDEMRAALKGLYDMYSHAWDLVDGGLYMTDASIPRFEAAHAAAHLALGYPPLITDEDIEEADAEYAASRSTGAADVGENHG